MVNSMPTGPDEDDQKRDEVLKRMLATKPTPKETKPKETPDKKKGPATKPTPKR
jgi:hypothetical protein